MLVISTFSLKGCLNGFVNIVNRSIWASVCKVMIAFGQKLVKLESLRGTHYFLAQLLFQLD